MKNITVTLDEKTASWVRVHAAKLDMSVSRYLGELLRKTMTDSREYDEAMQRWLSRKPVPLREDSTRPYPTRDEIYDR
jgi:hypothetical protein